MVSSKRAVEDELAVIGYQPPNRNGEKVAKT